VFDSGNQARRGGRARSRHVRDAHAIPGGAGQLEAAASNEQIARLSHSVAVTRRILRDRFGPADDPHVVRRVTDSPGRAQIAHHAGDELAIVERGALGMPGAAADGGDERATFRGAAGEHAARQQHADAVQGSLAIDQSESAGQHFLPQSDVDDGDRGTLELPGQVREAGSESSRQLRGRGSGDGEDHAVESLALDRPSVLRRRELTGARSEPDARAQRLRKRLTPIRARSARLGARRTRPSRWIQRVVGGRGSTTSPRNPLAASNASSGRARKFGPSSVRYPRSEKLPTLPPARASASKTTGSAPRRSSSCAAARPAIPPPITAIRTTGASQAIRCPGIAMLSPPITGPTGTNGGANEGIGPLPRTSITCCDGSHMRKAIESTVAMASC